MEWVFSYCLSSCQCPAPSGSKCNIIWKNKPLSCITEVDNGTVLTWFDMQEKCSNNTGRLLWLRDDFNATNLAATEKALTGVDFIVIGLLHSMIRDGLNFWRNPDDNNNFSCGTEDTDVCLPSSATEKQCNMIGSCWLHGKCQYPEHQSLLEENESDDINTTLISGIAERSCVGLQRSGKDWTFKAFNCSMTSAANTGYVCEYKCLADWPDSTLKNVSWPRNTSTKISPTVNHAGVTTSTNPQKNTSTNTSTEIRSSPDFFDTASIAQNNSKQNSNERNGARNTIYSEIIVIGTLILVSIKIQRLT